jgi:hypothetical protein
LFLGPAIAVVVPPELTIEESAFFDSKLATGVVIPAA